MRFLVGALLVALEAAGATPESQFRFDSSHTGVAGEATIAPSGLAWRAALGGRVRGTPAVADGLAFVGGEGGRLAAVRLKDGSTAWSAETGTDLSSSPAVAGGLVALLGRDGTLRAFDVATGAVRWTRALGRDLAGGRDPRAWDLWVSSPCVRGETLFVGGGDGGIHALSLRTGEPLWRFETAGRVRSTPAVFGGRAFVGSFDGNVYALDASTGALLWKHDTGAPVQSSPAVDGGLVFFGSRAATVTALDAATGAPRWKAEHPNGSWVLGSPAVAGGRVFVGSSDEQFLQALDAATGKELWRLAVRGRVIGAPTVSGKSVLFGTEDAHLFSADTATGLLLGGEFTEGGLVGGVVPADGLLLAGCDDGWLYAFRAARVDDLLPVTAPADVAGLRGAWKMAAGPSLTFRAREGRLEAVVASLPPAMVFRKGEHLVVPLLGLELKLEPAAADAPAALVARKGTREIRFVRAGDGAAGAVP